MEEAQLFKILEFLTRKLQWQIMQTNRRLKDYCIQDYLYIYIYTYIYIYIYTHNSWGTLCIKTLILKGGCCMRIWRNSLLPQDWCSWWEGLYLGRRCL